MVRRPSIRRARSGSLKFDDVQVGMRLSLRPANTAPGTRFTGTVVQKKSDRVVMEWDDPNQDGPRAELGIPKQRPELKRWWDEFSCHDPTTSSPSVANTRSSSSYA